MEMDYVPITPKRKIKSKSNVLKHEDLETLSLDVLDEKNSTRKMNRKGKFSSLSLSIDKKQKQVNDSQNFVLKDHYEIIDTLGVGAYSYVRHCIDSSNSKHVAVKTSRGETS